MGLDPRPEHTAALACVSTDELRRKCRRYAKKFSGKYTHRLLSGGIGHNLPQEAPQAFADAIIEVDRY
jgi:hypothetical protein